MIPHDISVESTVCTIGEILRLKVCGLFAIGDKVNYIFCTVMFFYICFGFVVCWFFFFFLWFFTPSLLTFSKYFMHFGFFNYLHITYLGSIVLNAYFNTTIWFDRMICSAAVSHSPEIWNLVLKLPNLEALIHKLTAVPPLR